MTPKEKAKELVDKFISLYYGINLGIAKNHWAKKSALIAADEILNPFNHFITTKEQEVFWEKVKHEIEKL